MLLVALIGSGSGMAVLASAYLAPGAVPGLPEPGPGVRYGLPAVRTALNIAALLTVGLSVLPRLLGPGNPRRSAAVLARADRAAVITSAVWLLCALLALVLQAAELHPGRTATTGMLTDYATGVPAGTALLAVAGCAAVSAVLGVLAARGASTVPAGLRTAIALLGLLPLPLTGHAGDWRFHDIAMISVEVHVLAAAVWTGGLAALTLFAAPARGLLAEAVPRFSALATAAILVVAVSGAFNGLVQVLTGPGGGFSALLTTAYGQLVLAKLGCLALLAGIAARMRYRLLPRIRRHQRTALLGWAVLETGVLGAAYGLGVVLARAPALG
nr:CopD family protein [Saccharopolyspora sp. HNM0983]